MVQTALTHEDLRAPTNNATAPPPADARAAPRGVGVLVTVSDCPGYPPIRRERQEIDFTLQSRELQSTARVLPRSSHLHCRSNPARASVRTTLGVVDADKGRVTRLSDPLEISENLITSPDGKLALAMRQFGVYLGASGGIGRGGRGSTHTVTLVDMEQFKILGKIDDVKTSVGQEPPTIVNAVWSPSGGRVATVRSDLTVGI
jgi:hypothetical protein